MCNDLFCFKEKISRFFYILSGPEHTPKNSSFLRPVLQERSGKKRNNFSASFISREQCSFPAFFRGVRNETCMEFSVAAISETRVNDGYVRNTKISK